MGKQYKPSSKMVAMFRMLRDAGGFWSCEEAAIQMQDELPIARREVTAERLLRALLANGHVVGRDCGGEWCYGVTLACEPPEGESMTPSPSAPAVKRALVSRGLLR